MQPPPRLLCESPLRAPAVRGHEDVVEPVVPLLPVRQTGGELPQKQLRFVEDPELQRVEEVVDPYGEKDQEVRRTDRLLEPVVQQLLRPPAAAPTGVLEELPSEEPVALLEQESAGHRRQKLEQVVREPEKVVR